MNGSGGGRNRHCLCILIRQPAIILHKNRTASKSGDQGYQLTLSHLIFHVCFTTACKRESRILLGVLQSDTSFSGFKCLDSVSEKNCDLNVQTYRADIHSIPFYLESVWINESLFLKGKFQIYAEKHFLANITTNCNSIYQTKIPSKIAMSEKKLVTVDYHQ